MATYFAGVDTAQFPSVEVMRAWREKTNLRWTVFYLWPAPSQRKNYGWMGQREALARQGWGILPVFLGRQTAGPGSKLAGTIAGARAQGAKDGSAASALMKKAGFASGHHCALDVENPPAAKRKAAMLAYIEAWASALASALDTHYKPAVYCSYLMAAAVRRVLPSARLYTFKVGRISKRKHAVRAPFATPAPSALAFCTQYEQNALIAVPGTARSVLVDLNTAQSANPGQ